LRPSGTENSEEDESIRTQIPQVGEQIFKSNQTPSPHFILVGCWLQGPKLD
jgi:hypothetical protein